MTGKSKYCMNECMDELMDGRINQLIYGIIYTILLSPDTDRVHYSLSESCASLVKDIEN